MKKPVADVVGFDFQVIPLEDAKRLVLSGDGNYSELRSKVLEEIPKLKPEEAFSFGLPNRQTELDEKVRRGICMTINSTLRKVGLDWKATYSSGKKLFLVVPRHSLISKKPKYPGYTPKSKHNKDPEGERKILDLKQQGVSASEAARRLGFPITRVSYIYYQKYKAALKKGDADKVWLLHKKGVNNSRISEQLGIHKSQVGAVLTSTNGRG